MSVNGCRTSCATAHPFANSLEGCVADAEGEMPLEPCHRCLADCTPVGKYANGSPHAVTGISYPKPIRLGGGKHGFQVIHFLGNGAIGKLAPGIAIARE